MPVRKSKRPQPKKLFSKASKKEFRKQIISELYSHGEYVESLKKEIDKIERSRDWWKRRAKSLEQQKARRLEQQRGW